MKLFFGAFCLLINFFTIKNSNAIEDLSKLGSNGKRCKAEMLPHSTLPFSVCAIFIDGKEKLPRSEVEYNADRCQKRCPEESQLPPKMAEAPKKADHQVKKITTPRSHPKDHSGDCPLPPMLPPDKPVEKLGDHIGDIQSKISPPKDYCQKQCKEAFQTIEPGDQVDCSKFNKDFKEAVNSFSRANITEEAKEEILEITSDQNAALTWQPKFGADPRVCMDAAKEFTKHHMMGLLTLAPTLMELTLHTHNSISNFIVCFARKRELNSCIQNIDLSDLVFNMAKAQMRNFRCLNDDAQLKYVCRLKFEAFAAMLTFAEGAAAINALKAARAALVFESAEAARLATWAQRAKKTAELALAAQKAIKAREVARVAEEARELEELAKIAMEVRTTEQAAQKARIAAEATKAAKAIEAAQIAEQAAQEARIVKQAAEEARIAKQAAEAKQAADGAQKAQRAQIAAEEAHQAAIATKKANDAAQQALKQNKGVEFFLPKREAVLVFPEETAAKLQAAKKLEEAANAAAKAADPKFLPRSPRTVDWNGF